MTNKHDLAKLIDNHCLVDWIRMMKREDLLAEFGSDFAVMKGFHQNNPHHCYDLLEHTLHTVSSIDITGLDVQSKLFISIAALFHDIGKPLVVKEKSGRNIYYGHAKKSKDISVPILIQMGFTNREIDFISFLVEHHDDFINYRLLEECRDSFNQYLVPIDIAHLSRYYEQVCKTMISDINYYPSIQDILLLCRLCQADISAQSSVIVRENGDIIETRENKIKRYVLIEKIFASM